MISSLDLIDGRGPGFPRPREAKIFGPFFPPQNILYVCIYIYIYTYVHHQKMNELSELCQCCQEVRMHETLRSGADVVVKTQSLGLRSGFDPPDLDRPGRLPHQQGLAPLLPNSQCNHPKSHQFQTIFFQISMNFNFFTLCKKFLQPFWRTLFGPARGWTPVP